MSASLGVRNNPIQTVMDYVGQDVPRDASDGALKAVAAHLDQPFKFEELPQGILGEGVFPFLLDSQESNEDVRKIVKTNAVWARAVIDWIKTLEFHISRYQIEKFNRILRNYTCLRPVSRSTFIRACNGKEVFYDIEGALTQQQIQADIRQFNELGIRIIGLHSEWCRALTDELIQNLLNSAPRYLTLDNCGTLPDDSLRHLPPNSLEELKLSLGTKISESQLIKLFESQGRLKEVSLSRLHIQLTDATFDALIKSCSKSLTLLSLTHCVRPVTTTGWTSLFAHCQQLKDIFIHTAPSFTAEVILGLPKGVDWIKLNDIPEPAPETWVAFAKARGGRPLIDIRINNRNITNDINRMIQGEQA